MEYLGTCRTNMDMRYCIRVFYGNYCLFVKHMMTILLFILILSLLVFVHEFGHFIVARKSGMKVYEFGFGFPPRAFGVYKDPSTKKWVFVVRRQSQVASRQSRLSNVVGGEEKQEEYPSIVYSVNWLPLGGFVKIKGENGEEAAEPDSFGYHPFWKKAAVLVAGVSMNFLLAAVLLGIGFTIGLPADAELLKDPDAIVVEPAAAIVNQVEVGSPADMAELALGDIIRTIDGVSIESSKDVIQYVQEHGMKEMTFAIDRDGEIHTFSLTPADTDGSGTPRLGIFLADAGVVRYPWYIAIWKGFLGAVITTVNIVIGFYLLLKHLILGQGLLFDVAGPVGIATIVGQSARLGIAYLINVTAMLSLSLAVINILPIPALDGGRLLFVTIEKIFGRPVPMKYEQTAHTIGFVLLMLLIVVVTWRDVVRIF